MVCIVCMDYTAFLAFVTLHAVRIFFHPSFSLVFRCHFHHPFRLVIWFQLFACLIRAAIFSFNSHICVDLSFVIILPQAFVFSFFLSLFLFLFLSLFLFSFFLLLFFRRHLRSVFFSACLALVLDFRVSVYPSSNF